MFLSSLSVPLVGSALRAQDREPSPPRSIYITGEFERGSDRWLPGFTDYSFDVADTERIAEVRQLPRELESSDGAYFLSSRNTPDDLFTFMKKPATARDGVAPDRSYQVDFLIQIASDAPTGCAGIGGSPGGSVYLKVGASAREPVPILEEGAGNRIRLNVDKGGQSTGGEAADVVSNIENGIPCEESEGQYVLLERRHRFSHPVRTDLSQVIWLFVGVDSGFEGTTSLYYARVLALLTLLDEGEES